MNKLNTTSVGLAVTPTVVSTLFSHYLNRKPLKERPTARLSYDEGLHLVRSFLEFASHHTVEELQAFTAQWVPHPQWVKVDEVTIPEAQLERSAALLQAQLGPDGIRQIGGQEWWQWRKPKVPMAAEWIEMKSDANDRKKNKDDGRRVMMYIHGGAYFFGSVDEHRYQMQRHARKLKARVFAPKYRLAPQFPFPCGLMDCLAAYLHLLTVQDPSTIILAGDSAGGGMAVSLMCLLRDQGTPLPAGAVLISPWVDLTHSFPSVGGDAPFDYIPQSGFHHRPSRAWPPPNEDDVKMLAEEAKKKADSKSKKAAASTKELKQKQQAPMVTNNEETQEDPARAQAASGGIVSDPEKFLSIVIDGEDITVKDQIQMYTTNALLTHPLVSPIMQPTLGGLPPLLIMVGGGEILRDEQVYLAHKCAYPDKYAPPRETLTERGRAALEKYKPTDVQLQVWDDLCHVAPTLSFTRPAKYMYRSVSQFGAWALARAQHRGIEIMDDDAISFISNSGSESAGEEEKKEEDATKKEEQAKPGTVGRAGDPLPAFKNHMIRQRVTRDGITHDLAPESALPGCCMKPEEIGVIKAAQVKKWLDTKNEWDRKYATAKAKVYKKTIQDMATGFISFGPDENPPATALAGRRRADSDYVEKSKRKSIGLALWSLWGSKHDEATVERERQAMQEKDEQRTVAATSSEGQGARPFSDIEEQAPAPLADEEIRSRSRRRTVVDENQTGSVVVDENTPVAQLLDLRRKKEASQSELLSPTYAPETGAAGKRPFIDGIAMPFTLKKDADTASMMTLNSAMSPAPTSRPMSSQTMLGSEEGDNGSVRTQRPGLESFVTADELPTEKQGA